MSSKTRPVYDPFLGKWVEISDDLCDRLRGRYAVGPTLPNGEPEFGWREGPQIPIQMEAAAEIEHLRTLLARIASIRNEWRFEDVTDTIILENAISLAKSGL